VGKGVPALQEERHKLLEEVLYPGVELRANRKSISRRCHLFEADFWGELTKETITLPLGCLQGGNLPDLYHRPRMSTCGKRGANLVSQEKPELQEERQKLLEEVLFPLKLPDLCHRPIMLPDLYHRPRMSTFGNRGARASGGAPKAPGRGPGPEKRTPQVG